MSSFFFSSFAIPASVGTRLEACLRYGRSGLGGRGPLYFCCPDAAKTTMSKGRMQRIIMQRIMTFEPSYNNWVLHPYMKNLPVLLLLCSVPTPYAQSHP